MSKEINKELSSKQGDEIIKVLKSRFEKSMHRHPDIDWRKLESKLLSDGDKLWSLNEMENTGGKPDVVGFDKDKNEYIFYDCSVESPAGRRSICYDRAALESRKKFKPKNNTLDMADAIGIKILTEKQYRELQKLGNFDTKTSSWIATPKEIRALGGALFADFRFNTVFVYYNGAESYYAARGFRGSLNV